MAKVAHVTQYWLEPPPEPSKALVKWLARIKAGFRRNRRLSRMGYHEAAEWYGVYIWEYLNVLQPLLMDLPPNSQPDPRPR